MASRTRSSRARARLMRRFLLGQPLDGRRYSNGTFWRRGDKVVRAPWVLTWDWWTLAAGWQRAAVRLAAVAVLLAAPVAALVVAAS